MPRFAVLFSLLVFAALPLRAASPEQIDELARALGLPEIIEIMRDEGVSYGDELAQDMFPERGGEKWGVLVNEIYDDEWMNETVWNSMNEALAQTDVAPLIAFFTGNKGKRIVALEVSARRALMDSTVEEASKEKLAALVETGSLRLEMIERYIAVNDLLENNVVGSMNSNFAFYTGLADAGAFDESLTEEQILQDIWSQEAEIREDTEEWLLSFLLMAYQPLDDSDLEDYIVLSKTPEGQDLNRALFAAFDRMFVDVSRSLGRSAALFMAGEDL